MDFAKFEAIWRALWAWLYKAFEYFGLDLADGDKNGSTGEAAAE